MKVALMAIAFTGSMSSFAQQPPASVPSSKQPAILTDGVGAKLKRVDNMHEVRFIEIFLATRDPKTGTLIAPCYNTMFTAKGIPASKDTAPQGLVEGLDFEK